MWPQNIQGTLLWHSKDNELKRLINLNVRQPIGSKIAILTVLETLLLNTLQDGFFVFLPLFLPEDLTSNHRVSHKHCSDIEIFIGQWYGCPSFIAITLDE